MTARTRASKTREPGDKSTGRVSQDRKERTGHAEYDSKGRKMLQDKCSRITMMGQPR
jgi:hypothetical protein